MLFFFIATSSYAGVLDKFKKDATIQCGLLSSRIDGEDFTEDFLAQGLIKDEMSMTINFKKKWFMVIIIWERYQLGMITRL